MANLTTAVDLLNLLGDPTRVRLMALLARQELSVAELTNVTQLPQSRVSTHLGKLREAELLRDRRAGASTFYMVNEASMPAEAKKLWGVLANEVDDAVIEGDRKRAAQVVEARKRGWPESVAGEMERHWSPGRTWESLARGLVGLLRLGDVLDVGAGDGAIAEMLSPRAKSWTGIDASPQMVEAARRRLPSLAFELGDAHALPFRDHQFDDVLLFNVLPSAAHPAKVLSECARVLRKGGRVAIITLDAHDHLDVTSAYGHLHAGFKPSALRKLLDKSGLDVESCEVTSRERRAPHFSSVTAFALKR
jgi:ArsR family transcriptional regulator